MATPGAFSDFQTAMFLLDHLHSIPPWERLVRTSIAKLAEQLAQESVTATAVILYGALAGEAP